MKVVLGSRCRSPGFARAACAIVCLLALAGPARAADPDAAPPAAAPDPAAQNAEPAPAALGADAAEPAAAPPPADSVDAAEAASRIAGLSGTVAVHGSGQSQWLAAVAERALAAGEGVWTEPGAKARLEVGAAAVELGEKTQLELAAVDGRDAELRLVQGALDLSVPGLARGASYQIDTPRGAVRVMLAGHFVIEAGGGDQPTKVTVIQGAAQVAGSESGLVVSTGQTGLITGVDGGLSFAIEPTATASEAPTAIAPPPATDEAPVSAPTDAPAAPPASPGD